MLLSKAWERFLWGIAIQLPVDESVEYSHHLTGNCWQLDSVSPRLENGTPPEILPPQSHSSNAGMNAKSKMADKEVQSQSQYDDEPLQWSQINEALSTQCRVIHALILRETLSRYGDHKLGFLWAVLEPLFFVTMMVGFMAAMNSDAPGGMPIVPFMITGFVPFLMMRNVMNQLKGAVSSNRNLLGFPQVTTFDVMFARILLEGAVMTFVFVFILGMAFLLGFEFEVENPLGVLITFFTLMLFGSGLGFLLASLIPIVPSIGQLSAMLFGRPLLLASGLFYTAASVPEPFRTWLLYNPVLHLMELLRSYFFYEFESAYGSWFYAGSCTFGLFVFGLLTHKALKRRTIVGL